VRYFPRACLPGGAGLKSGWGDFLFVGKCHSQSWGRGGVLGKGASHGGAPGSFPGDDPNVPVADCVRRYLQLEIT
jgi:hypothetical protein